MKKFYIFLSFLLIAGFSFGQTAKRQNVSQKMKTSENAIYSTTWESSKDINCAAGSLFGNDLTSLNSAAVSEVEAGYTVGTVFQTIGGTIETLSFWAINAFHDGTSFGPCTEASPMVFNIYFYENNAGVPGTLITSFMDVNVTGFDSGEAPFAGAYTIYQYDVTLPTPVAETNGIVVIEGNTANSCWFLWINSSAATGGCANDGSGWVGGAAGQTICMGGTPPACAAPTDLAVVDATDVTATIGWTENGTATTWEYEFGAEGFTPTGTGTSTTTNPQALTGLTAGTGYDFYVRADCGGVYSSWTGPFTFYTANCPVAEQCNYVINMTDSYGDGWNNCAVAFVEDGLVVGVATLADGASGTQNIAICDASSVEIYWVLGSWAEEVGFTIVDPFGTTLFTSVAPAADSYTNMQMIHSFTSSCTPPACPAPTTLTATGATTTSAVLGWTETGSATAWNVEIGAAGFTPTGTGVAASTNPYTATGLTAGTSYEFYVQADCGGATSTWVGPFAFNTACATISTYPYTEGFETGVPPVCWSSNDADGDTYNWSQVAAPDFPTHGGDYAAMSASWVSGVGALTPDNYLISPQFNINAANLELSCWFAAQDADYPAEQFSIMVSTTGTAPADFTAIHTATLASIDYVEVVLPLAAYNGQNVYFAIRHWGVTDMFQMKADDFTIDFADGIENSTIATMSVYPNPSTGIIQVSNAKTIVVYNMIGEVVATVNNASTLTSVDLSNLSDGAYIVKANNGTDVITKKINIIK